MLNRTHITNSHNLYSLFGMRKKKEKKKKKGKKKKKRNKNKTKTKKKKKEKASSLISPSKVLSAFSLILCKISKRLSVCWLLATKGKMAAQNITHRYVAFEEKHSFTVTIFVLFFFWVLLHSSSSASSVFR